MTYLAAIIDDVLAIVVPASVLDDDATARRLIARSRRDLGREAVLLSPTRRATVMFYGRADLAAAVRRAPLDRARWTQVVVTDDRASGDDPP